MMKSASGNFPDLPLFRRTVRPEDVEAIREIVESTGFFYDFEIPVAVELVEEKLQEGDACDYEFLFAEIDGKTVSYTCFGPIAGTEGSFDLYWIVTHNEYRGQGIGRMIIDETHRIIREMGGRIVVAETSSTDKYIPTRKFYDGLGYVKEAQIDDFYTEGDGKVFFVKRL
jgi:ribosomal protein S18 acetylase RimI-like enzyme